MQSKGHLRLAVVRWLGRHLATDMEIGALTNFEFELVMRTLRNLAKHGDDTPPPEPLRLITGQAAAALLGISYSQFRALEAEGVFPFHRKMVGGKTVRYRSTDIQAYMQAEDQSLKITEVANE